MAIAIKIEKQPSKLIKPFVQTHPTISHYKLGFIDEFAPMFDIGVVLFFSTNINHNPKLLSRLENSLAKTLTRLYPLAGRYVEEIQTIDCNDVGAEFIYAKVNIKLENFLVSEENVKFIDDFIPSKIGVAHKQSDPLLATQVTTFECGSVAIGVSATHKLADASTLCTFINEWAVTNRQENEIKITGPGFNSSVLFPARGLSSMPMQPMNDGIINKYTRKKFSFSESFISNIKAKGKNSTRRWSKVQLVAAIIWKTFIDVDLAIHKYQRKSKLIQAINLREKMACLIPKSSCGNLWGLLGIEWKDVEKMEELADHLCDTVNKTITMLKGNHSHEEAQEMVLNSLSSTLANIDASTNAIILTSWCKFPFYEADFGFGKPSWAAPGTMLINNSAYFMDDAQGNGVEAYVFLEAKDVPCFEETLEQVMAFATN